MVQVTGHLGVSELQCGYRGSTDVKLARHYYVNLAAGPGACGEGDGPADGLRAALDRGASGPLQPVRAGLARPPAPEDDPDRGGAGAAARAAEEPPDDGGVWASKKVAALIAAELGLATGPSSAAGRR